MKWTIALAVLAIAPWMAFGQSTKDQIKEVQRDVASLQDDLRKQNDKITELGVLLHQALDASNQANAGMAALQRVIADRLGEQAKNVGGTVAGVGAKVDQMADEFRGVKESIADLNSRMGKFDSKLTDISNSIRTIQTPVAPPPSGNPMPSATGQPSGTAVGTPPPSAEAILDSARRDYSAGKMELAMQEFQEYLKWFPNSENSPYAQFYIGEIFLRAGDADNAVKAYDAVLERYPENNKTPDAHYMKAKALFQAGRRTDAQKEYCEVVKRYPDSDLASKAKSALRGMGYSPSCGVAAVSPAKRSTKKRPAR
jgi:tol-pal system protein YbgF